MWCRHSNALLVGWLFMLVVLPGAFLGCCKGPGASEPAAASAALRGTRFLKGFLLLSALCEVVAAHKQLWHVSA